MSHNSEMDDFDVLFPDGWLPLKLRRPRTLRRRLVTLRLVVTSALTPGHILGPLECGQSHLLLLRELGVIRD